MKIKRYLMSLFFASYTVIINVLSGCTHNPETQVRLTMHSAHYLNPDVNGKSSPLVVNIYELKSPVEFNQSSFDQLSANASAALGQNLVDMQSIEIRPSKTLILKQLLTPDTRYLGIAAAYRDIDQANWRQVIRMPHKKRKVSLVLILQSQGISAHLK